MLAPTQINDVVRGVLALQPFANSGRISVAAELQDSLPTCVADRQLLATALENLVRNGFEAMSNGGKLSQEEDGKYGYQTKKKVLDTGQHVRLLSGWKKRLRSVAFSKGGITHEKQ